MKALIRNNDVLTKSKADSAGYIWINWLTGSPLTNKDWSGGPYHLIENYTEKGFEE